MKKNRDEEVAREIRAHLELEAEERVAGGMSAADAHQAARRAFGNVTRIQEDTRAVWIRLWVEQTVQDLRYTARTLARSPGFTSVAVLTLALGIGANTAIFSVVNTVLLQPLPYPNPDQLVRIIENVPPDASPSGRPLRLPSLTTQDASALRSRATTLSHIAMYASGSMALTRPEDVAVVDTAQVAPPLFPMLRIQPLLGRVLGEHDDQPGGDAVVVLAYAAWQKYFVADPNIVGRTVNLDGRDRAVIGVMPAGFTFPNATVELWIPLVLPAGPNEIRRLLAIARIKDGVTLAAASAEISTIVSLLRGVDPSHAAGPPRIEVVRVKEGQAAPLRPALRVLVVAVGFVVLIACTNVANLLLARSEIRAREIAVRAALGARRGRLVRQVLTESLVLALLGGTAGFALGYGGIDLLAVAWPGNINPGPDLPRIDDIPVDTSVFAFTLAASVLTGVLFGLMPALRVSRTDHMQALRDNAATAWAGGRLFGRNATRSALVIGQTAMAMVLLAAAGLLIHSFVKLSRVDKGFDVTNVLTFQVATPLIPDVGRPAFNEALNERLVALPDVQFAGYTWSLPMERMPVRGGLLQIPGMSREAMRALGEPPRPMPVSHDYLSAIGTTLIAGRMLRDSDGAGRPPVLLINRALARRYFPGQNPVGKLVSVAGPASWEIVGIVADSRQRALDVDPEPEFYVDLRQMPQAPFLLQMQGRAFFAIRTTRNPSALVSTVRAIVAQLGTGTVVTNVAGLDQIVANSIAAPRFYAVLIGIFAAGALVLATVGIYGLLAYSVAQRTREIGVRMALGAPRGEVLRLVLRQGMALTAIGIAIGLAGAVGVTRYLAGMLFGLTPVDPATYAAVAVVFTAVAMLASYVPARRATKVDPLIALRCE